MSSTDTPAARLATRLAFLLGGFGVACWAPLVPFAKARLAVDDGMLGMLLLCIGIGSLVAMPLTAALSARIGSRPVIVASSVVLSVMLAPLATASTPVALGAALLLFGAALGTLDVAMNIHAVEVERGAARPLMSGFHAMFSIGGFAGAAHMTVLLSLELGPLVSVLLGAGVMLVLLALAWRGFLRTQADSGGPMFAVPRGVVLLVAVLAAVTFLAEGALLDWSALLITQKKLVEVERGGLGYVLFSVAMTAGRLTGDALVGRIGDLRTLIGGGCLAVAGFAVLLTAPFAAVAFAGFVLIGLGAANIVPVLFRRAGTQTVMPPGLAIAAITTTGYAGILVGPAAIGFVADAVGLGVAFWMLAALLCAVPLCAAFAVPRGSTGRASRSDVPM